MNPLSRLKTDFETSHIFFDDAVFETLVDSGSVIIALATRTSSNRILWVSGDQMEVVEEILDFLKTNLEFSVIELNKNLRSLSINQETGQQSQKYNDDQDPPKPMTKKPTHFSQLTPDQQKELIRGDNRQIFIGSSSVAKTFFMQMKALGLLVQGEKVVIIAKPTTNEKYSDIFEKHGFKNYRLYDWIQFEDTLIELFVESHDNNEVILTMAEAMIERISKNLPFDDRNPLYKFLITESELASSHIFFDDALLETLIYSLAMLVAVATLTHNVNRIVWISGDFSPDMEQTEKAKLILEYLKRNFRFSVVKIEEDLR